MKDMRDFERTNAGHLVARQELADDGVLGVPVVLSAYTMTDASVPAPVIHYIVGTNTERIGTEPDGEILADLIREYLVIVIDYLGAESAAGIPLDYSIHGLRRRIIEGFLVGDRKRHPAADNWILPAGYRLLRHYPYFDLRRHAPIGTLDYIVQIWNEDFTEARGDREIRFPDGTVKRVRDIHPKTVEECLNKDGTPVELGLYLDVIYPSRPKEGTRCPIGVFAASRQSSTGNWVMSHFPGYATSMLFSGYGVMLFEHSYIPMARSDHYGYFPDGPSYMTEHCDRHHGLGFQTGIRASTAAIRALRYLCKTDPALSGLDADRLGMFCISKTGYNYGLAVKNPETLPEMRYLKGHVGECAEGTVQPFLTYPDGSPIPSDVQAVYTVSGAGAYYAHAGMAPVLNTVGERERGRGFYRTVVENARQMDTQSLFYTVPDLGHSMAYGYDPLYDLDHYGTVLDFMDTHLLRSHGECAYISPAVGTVLRAGDRITLHFTGAVTRQEMEKHTLVKDRFGRPLHYTIEPSFGGCVWTLTPDLGMGECVTVTVPEGTVLANGARTGRTRSVIYRTAAEHTLCRATMDGSLLDGEHAVTLSFGKLHCGASERLLLRFSTVETAAQTVGVYLGDRRVGAVSVGGARAYSLDVTDAVPRGVPFTLTLRAERPIGRSLLHSVKPTAADTALYTLGELATAATVDGALEIELDKYAWTAKKGYSFRIPLKESEWESGDLGRLFAVSARIMAPDADSPRGATVSVPYNRDPLSTYVYTENAAHRLVHPAEHPCEWQEVSFLFQPDDPALLSPEVDQRFVSVSHDDGKLRIGCITVEEITTPVRLACGGDEASAPRILATGLAHG